jgi:hypothetical protein
VFWFICWGMNIGRHAIVTMQGFEKMPASFRWLTEAGYWFLPKPADLGIILFNGLGAHDFVPQNAVFEAVQQQNLFQPGWSVTTSLVFTAVTIVLAAHHFLTTDY